MPKGMKALLLAGAGLIALLSFQANLTGQVPTFGSRTDLVRLDVSVLDDDRRPIRGLTKDKFSVLEDGKPQTIAFLDSFEAQPPPTPSATWMRDATPDVNTNEQNVTRAWVLVIDDALIPGGEPFARTSTLNVARQVVDSLGATDQAAVVFTADSRKAQDFTQDRTKLLRTLEQFSTGLVNQRPVPDGFTVNPDWQFFTGAVLTLRSVLQALVELPNQHKAVIWISPGITFDFGPGVSTGKLGLDAVNQLGLFMGRVRELTNEVIEDARRANVPIYPVHPCGLVPEVVGGVATPCGIAAAGEGYLWKLAGETNGHMIARTNDFGPGIRDIFAEHEYHYVIGYYPATPRDDGKFRRIDVKVDAPNAHVRTQSGYVSPKKAKAGAPMATLLERATASSIPLRDLPLRASAAVFASAANKASGTVAIAIGLPSADDSPSSSGPMLTDLQLAAFTTEGTRKAFQRSTVTISPRPAAGSTSEALVRMDLPPGRFRIRVAANQKGSERLGSVMIDVNVPDFASGTATMSDALVGLETGWPSAPRDLFKTWLPLVPTTQRTFLKSDKPRVYFEVYQRPAQTVSQSVSVSIANDKDQAVLQETLTAERISTARPAAGIAGQVMYDLPVGRLPAGAYIARFQVRSGDAAVTRTIRFEVRSE